MSDRKHEVGERENIDGVLYVGTACAGCGTVYLVYEQAIYDTGQATGNPVAFYCADCGPSSARSGGGENE